MPSPALKLGQGEYTKDYLVSTDLPPIHWWAKAIRWLADLFLNGGL